MGGQVSLELMDRVQFIYELALAKLELEGLSAKFEATNSMRKFNLLVGNQDVLKKRVAYFKKINGTTSDYERLVQFNQTTSIKYKYRRGRKKKKKNNNIIKKKKKFFFFFFFFFFFLFKKLKTQSIG